MCRRVKANRRVKAKIVESVGAISESAIWRFLDVESRQKSSSQGKSSSQLALSATLANRNRSDSSSSAASPGSGRKVAVKVQHPDLASALELDMAILRWCGNALGDRVAQTVDQFAVNFEAQLDLRDEAANLRKFNEHFSGLFWPSLVSFPIPVDDLVAASVLVELFEENPAAAKQQPAAVERLEQLTQVMPTVQQPAAAVRQLAAQPAAALRQLAAVEWAEHLTKVMPTLQQPEQQPAAVE